MPRLTFHCPWLPMSSTSGQVSMPQSVLSLTAPGQNPVLGMKLALKNIYCREWVRCTKGFPGNLNILEPHCGQCRRMEVGSVLPSLSHFQNSGWLLLPCQGESPLWKQHPQLLQANLFSKRLKANILFLSVGFRPVSEKSIAILSFHLPFWNCCFLSPNTTGILCM